MAADLAGGRTELLGEQRIGLAEPPRDAADGLAQLFAELRRSRCLVPRRAQELLGLGPRGALDLAAFAAPLGDGAVVGGLRGGEVALRPPPRALQDPPRDAPPRAPQHPPRLLVGTLPNLRSRGERLLLALVAERVRPRLGALE